MLFRKSATKKQSADGRTSAAAKENFTSDAFVRDRRAREGVDVDEAAAALPQQHYQGISDFYERASIQQKKELDSIKKQMAMKQKKKQQQHPRIKYHNDCYDKYHRRPKSPREVSEEFDIESNISGLTRDSDFTADNKEYQRPLSNDSNKNNRKQKKDTNETSMNKSSFLMGNLSLFGNGLGWRGKNKKTKDVPSSGKTVKTKKERRDSRPRSLSPARSPAASLLSLPSQDKELSIVDHPPPFARQSDHLMTKKIIQQSKAADLVGIRREPSPTRLAHPHIQYQMDRLMASRPSSQSHLMSPEPLGRKLDDFAFRPLGSASGPIEHHRAEPVGDKMESVTDNILTPMTAEIYVDDSSSPNNVELVYHGKASSSEKANVNAYYVDVQRDEESSYTFKGIDAEAAKLESKLLNLHLRSQDGIKAAATLTTVNNRDGEVIQVPWINYDPYAGRVKERVRARLWHQHSITERTSAEESIPALSDIHHPPVQSIDGNSEAEAVSSLDADKSDSFDWKAFANYLDTKTDKVMLHRSSKYRSLLHSPKAVNTALADPDDKSLDIPREPVRFVRRNRSTGQILQRSSTVEHKQSFSSRRSKEYLEFSPRESGGFLQATCFEETKGNRITRRRKGIGQSTMLDWMENIGDETATMEHNDSHELLIRSKKVNGIVEGSSSLDIDEKDNTGSKSREGKSAIRMITREASKKSLLCPNNADDESAALEEDITAGLYPMGTFKSQPLRRSQTKDIARQLPFPETPSPPKEDPQIARPNKTVADTTSEKQLEAKRAPATLSTSERKKIISEYLSARDGSSAKDTPRTKTDPPEMFDTPAPKFAIQPRTKAYEDYQAQYSVPTLGISPRSVMSIVDDCVMEPSSVACLRDGGRMDAFSITSYIPTQVSRADPTRRSQATTVNNGKRGVCPPIYNIKTSWKRYQPSRMKSFAVAAASGYSHLSSDESSAASTTLHTKALKIPVLTPKTESTKSTPSSRQRDDQYVWSPVNEPHPAPHQQIYDQLEI